jgi:hypothetical protein
MRTRMTVVRVDRARTFRSRRQHQRQAARGGSRARRADRSAIVPVENHQAIEQLERDGADDEQIDRGCSCDVVAQARFSALQPRSASPDSVSLDSRFADVEPEHQQFVTDPRRFPQRILRAHPADQLAEFAIDPGPAATAPRLLAPICSKSSLVAAQHRLRLDDDDCI